VRSDLRELAQEKKKRENRAKKRDSLTRRVLAAGTIRKKSKGRGGVNSSLDLKDRS